MSLTSIVDNSDGANNLDGVPTLAIGGTGTARNPGHGDSDLGKFNAASAIVAHVTQTGVRNLGYCPLGHFESPKSVGWVRRARQLGRAQYLIM